MERLQVKGHRVSASLLQGSGRRSGRWQRSRRRRQEEERKRRAGATWTLLCSDNSTASPETDRRDTLRCFSSGQVSGSCLFTCSVSRRAQKVRQIKTSSFVWARKSENVGVCERKVTVYRRKYPFQLFHFKLRLFSVSEQVKLTYVKPRLPDWDRKNKRVKGRRYTESLAHSITGEISIEIIYWSKSSNSRM